MNAQPIGINTYAYAWTTPAEEVVRRLADLGYSSFELLIHPPHLPLDGFDAGSRRRLATALDEVGVTHRSLNLPSLDHNLASPMPRARKAAVQMFRDTIDLAVDLGVDWLVLVPGRMSALAPPSHEQRSSWLREGVDVLLPYAEAKGVRLAVENIPMAAFPDSASLGAFARGYGSATLGVCYDAANAHFIGESPAEGIRQLADVLRIVHLSDTYRHSWRHDPVGQGDVPFASLPAALADAGFEGPCFLEIIDPDPEAAIIRSHDALAAAGFAPRGSELAV